MAMTLLSLLIVVGAVVSIFPLSRLASRLPLTLSSHPFISSHVRYQLILLPLALVTVALVQLTGQGAVTELLSVGALDAPAGAGPLLGISEGARWGTTGLELTLVISLVTATFMWLGLRGSGASLRRAGPLAGWIVLLAASNALAEELIFRVALAGALAGAVEPETLMAASALLFGAAHYRGVPGGAAGVLMAAVLGWILMKSVVETGGLFWAWSIHFLQDVIIYTGLLARQPGTGTTPPATIREKGEES